MAGDPRKAPRVPMICNSKKYQPKVDGSTEVIAVMSLHHCSNFQLGVIPEGLAQGYSSARTAIAIMYIEISSASLCRYVAKKCFLGLELVHTTMIIMSALICRWNFWANSISSYISPGCKTLVILGCIQKV